MKVIPTRKVGKSSQFVSELGFGTAPLGDLFVQVPEKDAQQILQAAWDGGIRYYDTAPFYGYGKAEHRLGTFLRQQPRSEFVVSTKVGRVLRPPADPEHVDPTFWAAPLPFDFSFDYSYDGIMRSFEDSLQRLSLNRVDMLLIHDLDDLFHLSQEAIAACLAQLYTSGWRALDELRRAGVIQAIGAGINRAHMMPRFLDLVDLDFFIVAMPYTLLDQEVLDGIFPRCEEEGVGVVVGAPFASGILATGPTADARYAYEPASAKILEKTRRIQTVCQRHDTPLAAAAMQFPLAHPLVAAIIPGAVETAHVISNVSSIQHPIPAALWSELKSEGLIRVDAPLP
jgi:D-threo-aldose 1-dehydrogenase